MNEMDKMMDCMSKEDKNKMMQNCCSDMKLEDMQNFMETGMPEMMGCCKEGETGMISKMMIEMMPNYLSMIFPEDSKENRIEFTKKIISILIEKCTEGMSVEEKKDLITKVVDQLKA